MSGPPSMKGVPRLVQLDSSAAVKWDRYVNEHPDATVYHLSAWAAILKSSYRFEPLYLAVEGSRGEITGILPLTHRRGPLTGARANSLPVIRWAGPIGRSIEEERGLLDAACDFVRSGKASRLHVSSKKEGYDCILPDLGTQPSWPAWFVELPHEPDDFWERFTGRSKSLRRNVRKAQKSGVLVREASSGTDLRRFYHLYLKTMRKHREPPRTLRQLAVSQRLLGPPGVFKLFVAEQEGRMIGGAVFHFFRDTVDLLYNASDDGYLDVRPNHAIYWEVIRQATLRGLRFLDFGAARPGTSLAEFKRRWSAEPVPRFHYTYPDADATPAGPRNRTERAFSIRNEARRGDGALLSRAWDRTPLTLTRIGGTLLYRYL